MNQESSGFFKLHRLTVRKYKFRKACRVHVMDRKSCKNRRRKKSCAQTTTCVTWHKKRTTPHSSRRAFCLCALHRFTTSTASTSTSQTCSDSEEKTHDFLYRGREIIALLSRHGMAIVIMSTLFLYTVVAFKKRAIDTREEMQNEMRVSQC